MKIKFLSKSKVDSNNITLLLKDITGNDIIINLSKGQFVYSQTDFMTNSLRIFERKNVIQISKQEKPFDLEYFKVYSDIVGDEAEEAITIVDNNMQFPFDKKENKTPQNPKKDTVLGKAIKEVNKYSKEKPKSKKKPGRPKKRGPKKGSKKKDA